jgi:hypothetical protein
MMMVHEVAPIHSYAKILQRVGRLSFDLAQGRLSGAAQKNMSQISPMARQRASMVLIALARNKHLSLAKAVSTD